MDSNLIIELNVVFARYDQATINGFSVDLAAIAEKWALQTKTTSFSVKEKRRRVKRLNANGDVPKRRSPRLEAKRNTQI